MRARAASSIPSAVFRLPSVGVLIAGMAFTLLTPTLLFGSEPVALEKELEEEIRILGSHVWDQSMARRFGQELELPVSEIVARYEIVERWLKVLEQQSVSLPEGFADRLKPVAALVEKSRGGAEVEMDPVLLFLEEEFDGLAKTSGLEIAPPTARGN